MSRGHVQMNVLNIVIVRPKRDVVQAVDVNARIRGVSIHQHLGIYSSYISAHLTIFPISSLKHLQNFE